MQCHRLFLSLVLPGLLLAAQSALAADEPLTVEEARELALLKQPMLVAYAHAATAAREAAIAEAQLPDPKLTVGIQNLPISGTDAYDVGADGMTMATVGVMQDMVRAEKRKVAASRMQAEAEQTLVVREAVVRRIERDVTLAWINAFAAENRAEFINQLIKEMRAERQVLATQLATDKVNAGEVLRLDTARSMMVDKSLIAQREANQARAELKRWIGLAASRPLPTTLPHWQAPENWDNAAQQLGQHPLLQAELRGQEVARLAIKQASADRAPDWSWELMYGQRPADGANLLSLQLAMDLPWDRPRRQDRRLSEKAALAERASSLVEDQRRELEAELQATRTDWLTAEAREREHRTVLLPAQRAHVELAKAGYHAGRAALTDVWEARRGLLEVEMAHWEIFADLARAGAQLEYLTGRTD